MRQKVFVDLSLAQSAAIFDLYKKSKDLDVVAKEMKLSTGVIRRELRWWMLVKASASIQPQPWSKQRPWTPAEDVTLLDMARKDANFETIAKNLDREKWPVMQHYAARQLTRTPFHEDSRLRLENLETNPVLLDQHKTIRNMDGTMANDPVDRLSWEDSLSLLMERTNLPWTERGRGTAKRPQVKASKRRLRALEKMQHLLRDYVNDQEPTDNKMQASSDSYIEEIADNDRAVKNTGFGKMEDVHTTFDIVVNRKRQHEDENNRDISVKKPKTDMEIFGEPCFYCCEHGHRHQDCVAPRICHICQEPDHMWLSCPVAARERKAWRKELGIKLD